jgi:hypothetical protein
MRSRNVLLSLVLVLLVLVFLVLKIKFWEPKKRVTFNRNPSRIEYTSLALCQMDCYRITANWVTQLLKTAEVFSAEPDKHRPACTTFAIRKADKMDRIWSIIVLQCGRVAKITSCKVVNEVLVCDCPGEVISSPFN